MCPVFGDIDPALRGQPRDTEGCKKGMQQGGVVSVPHILEIKLPVVVQNLRGGAEDLWLAMQDPVNARADLVSDVIRQWRRLGGSVPNTRSPNLSTRNFLRPCSSRRKLGGMPPLPAMPRRKATRSRLPSRS